MADPTKEDDLEDGEIESDPESSPVEVVNTTPVEDAVKPVQKDEKAVKIAESKENDSKSKKKRKSRRNKKNKNNKQESENQSGAIEDDFAGNIERAIRSVLKKDSDKDEKEDCHTDNEGRRKHKKRKKYEHDREGSSKKKRRHEHQHLDIDEDELMNVRGASPVLRPVRPPSPYRSDSYASDSTDDSRDESRSRRRPAGRNNRSRDFHERKKGFQRRHPLQEAEGVCLYYMQGKCHNDDCPYSHKASPPRKLELCKFYLMECCAKRDKCLYLHADFPCKYYHTGLPCSYKDECKFAHGPPLTEAFKLILLKHIESAPKEILGDFPRLSREGAASMVATTQMKLMQQFNPGFTGTEPKDNSGIPSLFEINIPKPHNAQKMQKIPLIDQMSPNDKIQNKNQAKVRQSRWCDSSEAPDVLSLQNLPGVLTLQQISHLSSLGIENLNQLSQLTVMQLNQVGLTMHQINEIQLNTMTIQKLGLINSDPNNILENSKAISSPFSVAKDLDMRLSPSLVVSAVPRPEVGVDIDMRFQKPSDPDKDPRHTKPNTPLVLQKSKDTLDIDQYTKDALKFSSKMLEDVDVDTEVYKENDKISEIKDIDHRMLQYVRDANIDQIDDGEETKSIDLKRSAHVAVTPARRVDKRKFSTTDDEENNLLIDEKWYSSDEERSEKHPKPKSIRKETPRPTTPPASTASHTVESASMINKLGDLSKIDISAEVTKLLSKMKKNLPEKIESSESSTSLVAPAVASPKSSNADLLKPRDPRHLPKKSPEQLKSPLNDFSKPHISKKLSRTSIYECIEGEPTDGRRRPDVDLRQSQDFTLPSFGDTDLRQPAGSGDVDFRLSLPFKPISNYTPATEIDGSITSHPPIPFKVHIVEIPRPDYTDIKKNTAKSQALVDPRLRKVFRLSIEEPTSDTEKASKPTNTTRIDPRRKPKEVVDSPAPAPEPQLPTPLDLQTITQNSGWYKELSTNQKIFVNQQLATVTSSVKTFLQDTFPAKIFDLTQVQNSPIICSIFNNLGITLNERAEFSYMNTQQSVTNTTPAGFNHTSGDVYNVAGHINNMGLPIDNNMTNIPMLGQMGGNNMGGMGNMPMGAMMGFSSQFPNTDLRGAGHAPTPGLLGIAPNIPHNFENTNFSSISSYGHEGGFNGSQYNGNMNDFNNMDSDQKFPRNGGHGGYHSGRGNDRGGRGNDSWGRGNNGNRGKRNVRGKRWMNAP